jgi:hypothetical protein
MSNLECLSLYFALIHREKFIDGYELKENIINHLPRLNNFVFNIRSMISTGNQISLPSNNDIQCTFTSFTNIQIISSVDYFPKEKSGQCHIYSNPYTMDYYYSITNNFHGGLFECVRDISLFDERPFEYEFFIKIAESFPFLTRLSLTNRKAQILKNNKIDYPLIKYPYLNDLELIDIHKDYVEIFLDSTKMLFSDGIYLAIDYRPLRRATHDFKRDAMRINCSKVTTLSIPAKFKLTQRFKTYFPRMTQSAFYT